MEEEENICDDVIYADPAALAVSTQERGSYLRGMHIKKKKNLFPVGKYNINTQNPYKHQIFITAYRRLPESFYKLSMLATYNT